MDIRTNQLPFFTLILAGGEGARLWPLSRKALPKQFLSLDGSGFTLIQNAARRAKLLTGEWEKILVISQSNQANLVRQQLPELPPANLILEPVGKSTAAAIGLGAVTIQSRVSEAVMAVIPSDHLFVDELPWLDAMRAAVELAAESECLVAIGVRPNSPSSNYGYLCLGSNKDERRGLPVYPVLAYIEKPQRSIAENFIKSENYLWNTGVFGWRLSVFLSAMKRYLPETYAGLQRIGEQPERLETIYPSLEDISIDYAVMEKSDNLMAVQGIFQRIDVGSLASLVHLWQEDESENAVKGTALCQQSRANIIFSDDGLVGLIGVENMIVIRHKNVVLVCPKDRAGEVKEFLILLDEKGLSDYR